MKYLAEGVAKRKEFEAELIEKAFSDPDFREHLTREPRVALQKYMGKALPLGFKLELLEEEENTLIITMPKLDHEKSRELSANELEKVSGGVSSGFQGNQQWSIDFYQGFHS